MLRICAGKFKSKRLNLPLASITRPSSDRLRQAVFNILANTVSLIDQHVLDGFAGSGAMGMEALSRGAASVVFCEKNPQVQTILQANILNTLKDESYKAKLSNDLFQLKANQPFNIIFLDPPYDEELENKAVQYLLEQKLIASNGIVIIEQRKGAKLVEYPGFITHKQRIYGKCQITMLLLPSATPAA